MLHSTKVELELISDADIKFILWKRYESWSRYKRYSKANNKYLKSYDPKQESKHIIYLYANNLHSYAMPKFLPTSGFKWIEPKEPDLNKYTSNSSKQWVLDVELEYAKELSKLHNDYPFAPDKLEIKNQKRLLIFMIFLWIQLKS